mgnify:CR=1 FL=1
MIQNIKYLAAVAMGALCATACQEDEEKLTRDKQDFEDNSEVVEVVEHMVVEPNAMDLGLSVLWGTTNLGAETESDYGNYYAWGDTAVRSKSTLETYVLYKDTAEETNAKIKLLQSGYLKYCYDEKLAYNKHSDTLFTLLPADDVAQVKLGGKWRMPTRDEFKELSEKCKLEWTTMNDVKGFKVTGPTGNFIFLPAAGSRYDDRLAYAGTYGDYWSSQIYFGDANYASGIGFNAEYFYVQSGNKRYYAQPVRPVKDKE